MSISLLLKDMTREEKLIAMEAIWNDLTAEEFPSPAWHADVLAQTEDQVASGAATFSDWEGAKQRVRQAVSAA